MQNFTASNNRTHRLSRRSFLKIGAFGAGGFTLPDLLKAEALAGKKNSHKSVIFIYLVGGPPHQDMFDLKPDAPKSYSNLANVGNGAIFEGTKGSIFADFTTRVIIPNNDDGDLTYYKRRASDQPTAR